MTKTRLKNWRKRLTEVTTEMSNEGLMEIEEFIEILLEDVIEEVEEAESKCTCESRNGSGHDSFWEKIDKLRKLLGIKNETKKQGKNMC